MVKKTRCTNDSPDRAKKIISRWVESYSDLSDYPRSIGDMNLVKFLDPDNDYRCLTLGFALFYLPVSAVASLRRTCKTIKKFVDKHEEYLSLQRLKVRCVNHELFTKTARRGEMFPQNEKENKLSEFREIYKNRYIEKLCIQDTVLTTDFLRKLIEEIRHCDGKRLLYEDEKMQKLSIRNCTVGDDVNDSDLFCQLIQVSQTNYFSIKRVPNFGRFVGDILEAAPDLEVCKIQEIGQLRINYEQARNTSFYRSQREFFWNKECSHDSFVHVYEWDVSENFVSITNEEVDEYDDYDADEEQNDDEEEKLSDMNPDDEKAIDKKESSDMEIYDHDHDAYMDDDSDDYEILTKLGCLKVCKQIQKHERLKEQILYIEDSMEYNIECEMNDGTYHLITKEDVDNFTSSDSLGWILCGSASDN